MNRMTDVCKNITFPQTSIADGKYCLIGWSKDNEIFLNILVFLPRANEVWGKVICLQVSVCPRGEPGHGGLPGQGARLVPGGFLSRGVPGGDPHPDGYCWGWYASYWNAFLLRSNFNSCWLIINDCVCATFFNVKHWKVKQFRSPFQHDSLP